MMFRSQTLIMGLFAFMLACSSSEGQPADAAPVEPPERSTDEPQPAPISQDTNSAPAPASDPAPGPAIDGGAAPEGGANPAAGGTGGGGSGTKCEASAPVEKEGNDTAATANL